MYVARNKDAKCCSLFVNKPKRFSYYWADTSYGKYSDDYDGELTLPSKLFPNLTWEDEPIEVDLTEVEHCTCNICGRDFKYTEADIVDASKPEKECFWHYVKCPECDSKNTIY